MSYSRENSSPYAVSNALNQSFLWMFGGLLLTALTSFVVAGNANLMNAIFSNAIIFYGLIIAELGLVFFLSIRVQHMSFEAALTTFLVYSILNGVTLSAIFVLYTSASIGSCFLIAALLFGVMAVYGYTTKRDLTSIGNIALMALVGIIIASLVNLFLKNNGLSIIISYLAIAIFVGLTAYDSQKIKRMAASGAGANIGILGALSLYLDFINIFLNLLRLFGKQK